MTTRLLESTSRIDTVNGQASTLGDHATFITSKNAGPFLVTMDVIFRSRESFEGVRDSGIITPELIAGLYKRDVSDVLGIYFFDPANALKVTMRRTVSSGGPGDTDVYGAQQHVPMMSITVAEPVSAGPMAAREGIAP